MGVYDDHIEAVARRRSEKLNLHGEKRERNDLKKMEWSDAEIERIIDLERRFKDGFHVKSELDN